MVTCSNFAFLIVVSAAAASLATGAWYNNGITQWHESQLVATQNVYTFQKHNCTLPERPHVGHTVGQWEKIAWSPNKGHCAYKTSITDSTRH
jgi:hypothetical protein